MSDCTRCGRQLPEPPDDPARSFLLTATLQVAVPTCLAYLADLTPQQRRDVIEDWAPRMGSAITEFGDLLLFKSKRKGETAHMFAHLARGLAVLAHAPGGVDFAGLHWCVVEEAS